MQDVVSQAGKPYALVADSENEVVYWAEWDGNYIASADLLTGAGSHALPTGTHPWGIARDGLNNEIYWTEEGTGRVLKISSGNIQTLVDEIARPLGLALDMARGKMYWANADTTNPRIQRANLDGTHVQNVVTGLQEPHGVAVDPYYNGGLLCWTDPGARKVQCSGLNGEGIVTIATDVASRGVMLDIAGGKIYWTAHEIGKIQRANLDGSGVEDVVTGLNEPSGIALAYIIAPAPTPTPTETLTPTPTPTPTITPTGTITPTPTPTPEGAFVVDATGDGGDSNPGNGVCDDGSGACTLRAAIEEANAHIGTDTIYFNIPGGGVHTIQPSAALPMITDPVAIDASSQPGASCEGGTLLVELDGLNADLGDGLYFATGGSSVRGLVINNFAGVGLVVGGAALAASAASTGSGGVAITCNFIGVDSDGETPAGNGGHGVYVTQPNCAVGGVNAGERNIIAHNEGAGVYVEGNASTGNAILSNVIHDNVGLGIDLAPAGVNANDAGDADAGPNNLQNAPEIAMVDSPGGQLHIEYQVPSAASNAQYPLRIEFFVADADQEEGEALIWVDAYLEAEAGSSKSIDFTPFVPVNDHEYIVATASDAAGNTSEFSEASEVLPPARSVSRPPGVDGLLSAAPAGASAALVFDDNEGNNSAAPRGVGALSPLVADRLYAFVADEYYGLRILDVTDPTAPVQVGGYPKQSGYPRDVAVAGHYAYLVSKNDDLRVIDISNPGYPEEVGSYELSGSFPGVAVSGDYLYVANDAGLHVLDVSNPAQPQLKGMVSMDDFALDVAVSGSYAYVAASSAGLVVVDVLDPANPQRVGGYDTPGIARGVAVASGPQGTYAYVADGANGLVVVDVSYPANPQPVRTFDTPGFAEGVAVSEVFAFVAARGEGLRVINTDGVPLDAQACDTLGNCNAVEIIESPNQPISQSPTSNLQSPTVTILSVPPLLDSADPFEVVGEASAPGSSLQALAVTADGVPIHTQNWGSGAVTETTWSATWTPAGDGQHVLRADVTAWDGSVASDVVTVTVDAEPPQVGITPLLLTADRYREPRTVDLTGLVTDTAGVAQVEWRIASGNWQMSTLASGATAPVTDTWRGGWLLEIGPLPDGATYTASARATDLVGHTTETSGTITVDVLPPSPVDLTLTSGGNPVAPGDTVRTPGASLDLAWTESHDGSGLGDYTVRWTAQTTGTVAAEFSETVPAGDPRTSNYPPGEGQKIVAQLASQDIYGQQRWQSFGPVYTDSPHTPDYVVLNDLDGIYHGWMESGCTLIGVDRRIERHAPGGAALSAEQRLYATWNVEALRLAWTGANWNTDGDLFIYLDTQAGGTSQVYNPYPATPDTVIHLPGVTPSSQANAMQADYLVWVQDSDTAVLFSSASDWSFVTELSAEQYQFDAALNDGHTDIYLPFNLIGVSDPAAASLDLVAFAAEQDALSLWAVMPNANAVNSGKVIATAPYTRGAEEFALSHRYHWESLGAGVCPNGSDLSTPTRYPDTDLYVSISAEPIGTVYSFLADDLFWLWDLLFGDDLPDVSSFFNFMDTDHPRVGAGQEIVYTINYRNQGTETANGVYVDVSAHYALSLVGGDQQVSLGDIGPGAEGTATFRGVVDLLPGEDWATVEALVYDAAHDPSGPPLDWIWIDHQVDPGPPVFFGIQQPTYLLGAGVNNVRGYAYDDSGVPLITLEIAPLGLGASVLPCPDATPDDGTWSCAWDATGSNDGDQFKVQLQATDGFSQTSELSKEQTFVVDAALPTVTLDVTATGVFSGSLVRGNAFTLIGDVFDDGGVAQVDVCVDGDCGRANLQLAAGPTTVIYDDVPYAPVAIDGGEVVRTFEVAEDFIIGQVSLGFSAEHSYRDDIQVELQSPDGTSVRLLDDDGISGTQFENYDVFLNDAAPMGPQDAAGDDDPANRFYERLVRPYEPLRAFQGESSAGTWTLRIRDLDPSSHDGFYNRSRLVLTPQDTAAKSGRWLYRTPGTGELDYVAQTISIYGEDVVGNRTTDPLSLIVWVDNVPPEITVDLAITEITLGSTETVLSGTVTDGGPATYVSAHVQTPRGQLYRQRAGRDGDNWWVDLEGKYPGRYTLWLIASDQAGNSTLESPFVVNVGCTAADLTATFVSAELAADSPFSVTVTAVISNTGDDELPADLLVGFYVYDTRIGTAATTQALGPGQSEAISLTWDVDFPGDYDITIVPNDGQVEADPPVLCSLPSSARQTISILDIPLVKSWNLMSAYVNPFNTDASVVQRPIQGEYVVIQGFAGGAQSYYPDLPPEVNTLKEIDAEHGYWIKTVISDQLPALSPVEGSVISDQSADDDEDEREAVATLRVVGEKLTEDRAIELDVDWNLVSYLPRQPLAVADALQSIDRQYTAVLGYDQGALSYYPDIDPSFNTLHEMETLFGYWIKMAQAGTLTYPATGDQILGSGYSRSPAPNIQYPISNIRQAERSAGVTPTHTWVNFYGTAHASGGAPLPVGATVLALDPDGVVCGATVVTTEGQYGLLACYGDDPTTLEDEGAQPGDVIQLVVDGQMLGKGTWTAHGDRQWRPLGKVDLWQLYLPLVRKGNR